MDNRRRTKKYRAECAPVQAQELPKSSDPVPTPRITTININDLSSESVTKEATTRRSQAADYLDDLLRSSDILAVQETGLRPGNKNYLHSRFPRSKILYNNAAKLGTAGTMIILSPEFTLKYHVEEERIAGVEGYVQLIRFKDPRDVEGPILWQLYNVYLHTSDKPADQLNQLQRILQHANASATPPITYMAGDFNFVHDPSDTSSVSEHSVIRGERKTTWEALLRRLNIMEVKADYHTRFKIC